MTQCTKAVILPASLKSKISFYPHHFFQLRLPNMLNIIITHPEWETKDNMSLAKSNGNIVPSLNEVVRPLSKEINRSSKGWRVSAKINTWGPMHQIKWHMCEIGKRREKMAKKNKTPHSIFKQYYNVLAI